MLRLFFIFFFFSFSFLSTHAQVQKIVIGVNGLTCSQCSKSVYNKLNHLAFIQSIDMDLNTHTATVQLKNGNNYNIDQLANSIIDAGYSVRNIIIHFNKDGLVFDSNYWTHNGFRYYYDPNKITAIPPFFTAEVLGKKYNSDRKINRTIPDEFISTVGKSFFVIIR